MNRSENVYTVGVILTSFYLVYHDLKVRASYTGEKEMAAGAWKGKKGRRGKGGQRGVS